MADAPATMAYDTTVQDAKAAFFDKAAVRKAVGPIMSNALSRFGAIVMTRARWSIRTPGQRAVVKAIGAGKSGLYAAPGQAPFNKTGLLRDKILFALDPATLTVVIGPAKLPGMVGDAPRALEYGGPSAARRGYSMVVPITVAAHPFMRPAFEYAMGLWPSVVKQAQAAGPAADWSGGGSALGNRATLFQSYHAKPTGMGSSRPRESVGLRSLGGQYASGGGMG